MVELYIILTPQNVGAMIVPKKYFMSRKNLKKIDLEK